MKIKINEARKHLPLILMAKLVPMIHGSPAVGKSAIVLDVAKEYNLKVIDLRLSQCDPTDLMGFPDIARNLHRPKAGYVPMETFPIEGDEIPEGYSGWLLFLDEFNSAPPAVQSAAYKVVLDRMVGQHKLHKNVAIVAAGNLETDGAIVQPLSTALQSRLVHLEVEVCPRAWCDWANDKGFNPLITSYIEFRPDNLYTFSPDHVDKTYASPRTWEFTNRLITQAGKVSRELLPVLAGTIGEGVAREFIEFCRIQDSLPKIQDIELIPNTHRVPDEPSVLHALIGAIAANANSHNLNALLTYVKRLPVEMQVVCLRNLVRRNKSLAQHEAIVDWIYHTAVELF